MNSSKKRYLATFLPLAKGTYPDVVVWKNVGFPFAIDLPNLILTVTLPKGDAFCIKELINSGRNNFEKSLLQKLEMTCTEISENILNTDCTIEF